MLCGSTVLHLWNNTAGKLIRPSLSTPPPCPVPLLTACCWCGESYAVALCHPGGTSVAGESPSRAASPPCFCLPGMRPYSQAAMSVVDAVWYHNAPLFQKAQLGIAFIPCLTPAMSAGECLRPPVYLLPCQLIISRLVSCRSRL